MRTVATVSLPASPPAPSLLLTRRPLCSCLSLSGTAVDHWISPCARHAQTDLSPSQLCASGAATATSALGLALVTDDDQKYHHHLFPARQRPPTRADIPDRDMSTTTTTTAAPLPSSTVFTLSSPDPYSIYTFGTPDHQPRRAPFHVPRITRSVSENAGPPMNRHKEPRVSLPMAADTLPAGSAANGRPSTGHAQHNGLLRRLSSNLSTSRDSSRAPPSRPGSSAVSQSNASSAAFSNAASDSPSFSASPSTLPPNKLVKRSSSSRSINSSPSASRLPLPAFRRPATSHQRTSLQHERSPDTSFFDHTTPRRRSDSARDPTWRQYFVPRVAPRDVTARGRPSTGIPNPVKRVYPDRRYRPTLVSGREVVKQASVEFDNGRSSTESSVLESNPGLPSSVASSPLFSHSSEFQQSPPTKRSFSIGDLLSTGPQPLWQNHSADKGKTLRRSRRKISSTSRTDVGTSLGVSRTDSEPPSKRRGLQHTDTPPRSNDSPSSIATHRSAGTLTPQEPPIRSSAGISRSATAPRSLGTDILHRKGRSPSNEHRKLPPASLPSFAQRQARLSAPTSEAVSPAASGGEHRSFVDTNIDSPGDTVFDSIPTRTTRSTSGRRGPPIDTIFDDTPPSFSSGRSTKLKDFLNHDGLQASDNPHRYSTIVEEDSLSTPVPSSHDRSVASSPSARAERKQTFASSPPVVREMPDPDEIDWDAPDEPGSVQSNGSRFGRSSGAQSSNEFSLPFRLALSKSGIPSPSTSTPQRNGVGHSDRASIFDWSEVQPSPSHNTSPPRPRTVHGKKDPENRGSRPSGRRAPSGMHARSHSVPVVPDAEGKRSTAAANKFGTWGVGSKAVTEDWNEDFDFEESSTHPEAAATATTGVTESAMSAEKRVDSGHEILVPRSIREQQENVMANIGLLREWGLLIEELKELRVRAVALDMLKGRFAQAWSEVDAMIELADQETEEHTLEPRRSPPSSPGFDYSAFEDPVVADGLSSASNGRVQSMVLGEPLLPPARTSPLAAVDPPPAAQHSPTRPRKDSEAIARSVIEALQARRTVSDPATSSPFKTVQAPPSRKVPFDTATLRHIVPYVNTLKRKVKDALRETEGLYKSPRREGSGENGRNGGDGPGFQRIFQPESPTAARRAGRSAASREVDDDEEAEWE